MHVPCEQFTATMANNDALVMRLSFSVSDLSLSTDWSSLAGLGRDLLVLSVDRGVYT